MASLNEKSPAITNVLTITRPSPSRQPSSDSIRSLTPPPTRSSRSEKEYPMEHSTDPSNNPAADSKVNITATDLEMGLTPATTQSCATRNILARGKSGVDPYPCRATQKRMRREQKLARAKCACWANMSKNHRKVIIVVGILIFIAIATTMAVLISKATGGGVYGKHGQTNAPVS